MSQKRNVIGTLTRKHARISLNPVLDLKNVLSEITEISHNNSFAFEINSLYYARDTIINIIGQLIRHPMNF